MWVRSCRSAGSPSSAISGTLAGVYKTPAVYADVTAVLTNTNPVRPYRGNGRPESAYVIERIIDVAADQLGIDPAELRRKNSIPPEAMPFKTGLTFTYDSGEFAKNMDEALHMARRHMASQNAGRNRSSTASCAGFGFSNTIERAAGPGYEGAEIRFDRSGSITLFSGSNNQGQGHETAFKQIVCDRLGRRSEGHHLRVGRYRHRLLRRRHRRLALGGNRRLGGRGCRRQDHRQGQADRRACAQGRASTI